MSDAAFSEREAREIIRRRLRLDPDPSVQHGPEDDEPRYTRADLTSLVSTAVNEHRARQLESAVPEFIAPDGWEYLVAEFEHELAGEETPEPEPEPDIYSMGPGERDRLRRRVGDAEFSRLLTEQLRRRRP